MANAITPSLRASLERLKHAGTINGLALTWRRQTLVSLMPFEDYRVEQLVHVLSDAREHFQSSGGRTIGSFWMAFPDVHILSVFSGDVGLVMLHVRPEESDFLTGMAQTFLNDAQLLVAAALSPAATEEQSQGGEGDSWLPQPPRLDPNATNIM
jgi:hypothetical protein